MTNKGKTVSKKRFISKRRFRFPRRVKKGQVTSKELSSAGYVTKNGNLKNSAPVESIAGVGLSKGSYLRSKGINTVGDFKGLLALEGVVVEAIPAQSIRVISKEEKSRLKQKAVKLRERAVLLSSKIEEKRSPATASQTWTSRRAGIISSMKADADHLAEIQSIMFSIADHMESDTLPESLKSVDTKTEIETINSYKEFPPVWVTDSHFKDLKEQTITKEEKANVLILSQAKRGKDNWLLEFSRSEINALDDLLLSYNRRYNKQRKELDQEKSDLRQLDIYAENYQSKSDDIDKQERELRDFKSSYDEPKRRLAPYKRLVKIGITDEKTFEQMKSDFEGIKKPEKSKTQQEIKAEEIKELEDKVRRYKISGFFPTPRPVANKMVNYAEIEFEHSILEPSAGNGWLADVIAEREDRKPSEIDVIESNFNLREILELKGYNLVGNDFLEYKDKRYDRILMNPPFEQDQDIDHVYHAFSLLKPKGRVVAIMSAGVLFRSTGKSIDFRDWVQEHGGSFEKLPEGSFKSSFISTGVHTVIVTIDKDFTDNIPKTKPIHSINGVTEKQVIDYIPEEAVENWGKHGWNVKTIHGSNFPTDFKTKRAAIEQARRHKLLWENTFDDPDRWVRPEQIKYVE